MPRKPPSAHVLEELRRRAVREHATAERRARHVPILHVGVPGEPHEVFAIDPEETSDQALRTDVVAALRQRARQRAGTPTANAEPLVWLTRGGDLEPQDLDMAWFAAARQAYGEAGAEPRFALVGRHGWYDPATGERRTWVRPRPID